MTVVSLFLTTLLLSADLEEEEEDDEHTGALIEAGEPVGAAYRLLHCSLLVLELVRMTTAAVVLPAVISASPCPACSFPAMMAYPPALVGQSPLHC